MGFLDKLKSGLKKTKNAIFGQVDNILKAFVKVDEDLLEELEELLIMSDVGVNATEEIIERLREQIKDYLDDASNAKSKADWARHELEEAKRQVESLSIENGRLRAELTAVLGAVSAPKNKKVIPINGDEK